MSTQNKCAICKNDIRRNEFLQCQICQLFYDKKCVPTTSKRLAVMMTKKQTWKCNTCSTKAIHNKSNTSSPTVIQQTGRNTSQYKQTQKNYSTPGKISPKKFYKTGTVNCPLTFESPEDLNTQVTVRRKDSSKKNLSHEILSPSMQEDDSYVSSSPNQSACSLPTFSETAAVTTLKEDLNVLSTQLSSAHEEISNLNQEIITLKKELEIKDKKINLLKQLVQNPTSQTPNKFTPGKNSSLKKIEKRVWSSSKVGKQLFNISLNQTKDTNISHCDVLSKDIAGMELLEKPNVCTNSDTENPHKTVYLFGGEQCSGLGATLYESRQSTQYEKYEIKSFIKPNATTEEILQTSKIFNYLPNDRIILSVGEHDTNPFMITTALSSFINANLKANIIVLGVKNNIHLNCAKLNYTLKHVCNNFLNSTFIATSNVTHNMAFLKSTCRAINFSIDSQDYDKKYISCFKKTHNEYVKKHVRYNVEPSKLPVRGTIPYYFQTIKDKRKMSSVSPPKIPKPGTIPFYFCKGNKSDLGNQLTTENKTFFRQ